MGFYICLTVQKEESRRGFENLPEEVFKDAITRLKKKSLTEVDNRKTKFTKLGDVWRINIAWEFAHA